MRLITALAPLALVMISPAQGQGWMVDQEASRVSIETDVFGATIRGAFSRFEADITLDPEDLANASIEAVVYTDSGVLSDPTRQSDMDGHAGLHPDAHPQARFVSSAISRDGDQLQAEGVLTLKDQSQPATLVFTLVIENGRAIAEGGFSVARADFGIGEAGWGAAAAEVRIDLHIEADAAS